MAFPKFTLKFPLRSYSKWIIPQVKPRYYHDHNKPSLISQDAFAAYQNSLPTLMSAVLDQISGTPGVARIKKITEYFLMGGKHVRGTLTISAYETLIKPDNRSEESLGQIHALAWSVEMLHSYYLLIDDIIDDAKTRRGKTCWHLLPDVNLHAMNDACLFRSFIHEILRHNFADKPSYVNILHLFHKAFLYTSIGQHLDTTTVKIRDRDLRSFNMNQYNTICEYKAAYYTFKLPIYLAMALTNKQDSDSFTYLDNICNDLGILIQAQNDYLECFGENTSGSLSIDIQEGKCTWLAVTALQRCTPAQRIVFMACYGSKEPAHVERIKRLYDELHLPQLYKEQERALCDEIIRKSQLNDKTVIPPEFFKRLVEFITSNSKQTSICQ